MSTHRFICFYTFQMAENDISSISLNEHEDDDYDVAALDLAMAALVGPTKETTKKLQCS